MIDRNVGLFQGLEAGPSGYSEPDFLNFTIPINTMNHVVRGQLKISNADHLFSGYQNNSLEPRSLLFTTEYTDTQNKIRSCKTFAEIFSYIQELGPLENASENVVQREVWKYFIGLALSRGIEDFSDFHRYLCNHYPDYENDFSEAFNSFEFIKPDVVQHQTKRKRSCSIL